MDDTLLDRKAIEHYRTYLSEEQILQVERLADFLICTVQESHYKTCIHLCSRNRAIGTLAMLLVRDSKRLTDHDEMRLALYYPSGSYEPSDYKPVKIYAEYLVDGANDYIEGFTYAR